MWYRVFGTNERQPQPAALLEHLEGRGLEVSAKFHGDPDGWFGAELLIADNDVPIPLQRYLATEAGIRDELNTWSAWLETMERAPTSAELLQHMIRTSQIFTLDYLPDQPPDGRGERLCVEMCRYLASQTEGVYQVDGRGFFAADGTLLLQEDG